jgi:hypothetical protein
MLCIGARLLVGPQRAEKELGFIVCVRTANFRICGVGAPAFMRGKERFSAPGNSLDSIMRFSAGHYKQLPGHESGLVPPGTAEIPAPYSAVPCGTDRMAYVYPGLSSWAVHSPRPFGTQCRALTQTLKPGHPQERLFFRSLFSPCGSTKISCYGPPRSSKEHNLQQTEERDYLCPKILSAIPSPIRKWPLLF